MSLLTLKRVCDSMNAVLAFVFFYSRDFNKMIGMF